MGQEVIVSGEQEKSDDRPKKFTRGFSIPEDFDIENLTTENDNSTGIYRIIIPRKGLSSVAEGGSEVSSPIGGEQPPMPSA